MEPNENIEPRCYNSLYRHGVDEKRRVQIPAKWRPAKTGTELTLVLWPKAKEGPCLRVLPPEQMAKLMRDIDAMPNSDPSKAVLKRYIGRQSVQATLDKSGRICLPEEMARAAGITDAAVLVGLLDKFEIWSPERHEKVDASDAITAVDALRLME
jgi:MraZ protein